MLIICDCCAVLDDVGWGGAVLQHGHRQEQDRRHGPQPAQQVGYRYSRYVRVKAKLRLTEC